jgi:ArsR family transcriptional regulator, cadmium/lead-responsive transcriptional repressor
MTGLATKRAELESAADELTAKFIRGLADVNRLRIVRYLLDGPRSVGEIVGHLRVPQSRISNPLACLKWCGYVSTQRDGRTIIYRIADERVREVLRLTRAIVADNAARIASCVRIAEE